MSTDKDLSLEGIAERLVLEAQNNRQIKAINAFVKEDYQRLAESILSALRNERERCAKVAETEAGKRCLRHQKSGKGVCGYEIANIIRSGKDGN